MRILVFCMHSHRMSLFRLIDSPIHHFSLFLPLFLLASLFIPLANVVCAEPESIPAVKTDKPPVIDGKLDDPCWDKAPKATNFIDKFTDKPVDDQTIAMILYDEKNIYVAFRCFDSQPDKIKSFERKRGGNFRLDDYVTFDIDTFHTHTSRFTFILNSIGTQFVMVPSGRAAKTEWEGDWKGASSITGEGWSAEMAIPFSILDYPSSKEPVTMGINFGRYQRRTGIFSFWMNIGPGELHEREGHWVGVMVPQKKSGIKIDAMTYLFSGFEEKERWVSRVGLDAKYPVTSGLTSVFTVNPDFSNIEQEVEGLDFSYQEKRYGDNRPFFQEGSKIFGSFYSRRVPDPDIGFKLYGQEGNFTLGILDCISLNKRNDFAISVERKFWEKSRASFNLVRKDEGEMNNQTMNAMLLLGRKDIYFGGSLGKSWTKGEGGDGMTGGIGIQRFGKLSVTVGMDFQDPGYKADDDILFLEKDVISINAWVEYNNEWRKGPIRYLKIHFGSLRANHYDGNVYYYEDRFRIGFETRNDYEIWVIGDKTRFEEFKGDWGLNFFAKGRTRDRNRGYGINLTIGKRRGEEYRYISSWAFTRIMDKIWLSFSSEVSIHGGIRTHHSFRFNYDITPERTIGISARYREGKINAYAMYHQKVRKGVDAYVIVGDPNASSLQKRILVKFVMPYQI